MIGRLTGLDDSRDHVDPGLAGAGLQLAGTRARCRVAIAVGAHDPEVGSLE